MQVIFRRIISATLIVYMRRAPLHTYSISLPYLYDIDMFVDWLQCDLLKKQNKTKLNEIKDMEVLKNLKLLLKINLGNILQRSPSYYVIARHIILE